MKMLTKVTTLLVVMSLFITLVYANEAGEKVTFYHHDHLGSVVIATDENGGLEWKREYEPYGKPLYNGDKSVAGYTGHEYVAESGLNYMKARWYEPELGRFLSPDPVQYQPGNPTSFNRYAYANNSPYMFVDPDGRAGEFAALRYTLGVIAVDAATADPSDVAAPVKGAGYLGAVVGTAIGGSLYWAGNKIINGPDTQGTPPGGGEDPNNKKDRYENPGHHDPSGRGPNTYNSSKSVLPKNHQQLWRDSRLGQDGNRWTKVGSGKKANFHRFQNDGNGNWHWNGSTNGVTKNGASRAIRVNNVPSEIIKWK